MKPQVDHRAASKPDEMPAVEVRRVEGRILGQEDERLDLRRVARHEGLVGVFEGPRGQVDAVDVELVVLDLALRARADGQDHVEEPVVAVLDRAVLHGVDLLERVVERRLREGRVQRVDVRHVVLDQGDGGLPRRHVPGVVAVVRQGVVRRGREDETRERHVAC